MNLPIHYRQFQIVEEIVFKTLGLLLESDLLSYLILKRSFALSAGVAAEATNAVLH